MNRSSDSFEPLLGGLIAMIDLIEDYQLLSEQKNVALAYICQTK